MFSSRLALELKLAQITFVVSISDAQSLIKERQFGLVAVDAELLQINGAEHIRQIRAMLPAAAIAMLNNGTTRSTNLAIEGLLAGADEVIAKTTTLESYDFLLSTLRQLLSRSNAGWPGMPSSAENLEDIDCLLMLASMGSLHRLVTFLSHLTSHFVVPVISVISGLPATALTATAQQLSARSPLRFYAAQDQELISPGGAWLCSADSGPMLSRQGEQVALRLTPDNASIKLPSLEPLLQSAIAIYQQRVNVLLFDTQSYSSSTTKSLVNAL
jgi:chemotaxis response regulator CheB